MNNNWWEILGVSPDASEEEIKKAWTTKIKIIHPDHGGDEELAKQFIVAYKQAIKERKLGIDSIEMQYMEAFRIYEEALINYKNQRRALEYGFELMLKQESQQLSEAAFEEEDRTGSFDGPNCVALRTFIKNKIKKIEEFKIQLKEQLKPLSDSLNQAQENYIKLISIYRESREEKQKKEQENKELDYFNSLSPELQQIYIRIKELKERLKIKNRGINPEEYLEYFEDKIELDRLEKNFKIMYDAYKNPANQTQGTTALVSNNDGTAKIVK